MESVTVEEAAGFVSFLGGGKRRQLESRSRSEEPWQVRMTSDNPASAWDRINENFYSREEIYDVQWGARNLSNYLVSAAPYGGAIAMVRNQSKLQTYQASAAKSTIEVFSASGNLLHAVVADKGRIKGLGWLESEKMTVIGEDGLCRIYHNFQGDFSIMSLGSAAEHSGVSEVQFWESGFVALLNNQEFVGLTGNKDLRTLEFSTPRVGENQMIRSWGLLSPKHSLSGHLEVVVSAGPTILTLDTGECVDQDVTQGPFSHVCVSPEGDLVAAHGLDMKLFVMSSDFQRIFSTLSTDMSTPPSQISWCGNESIVLAWEDEIEIIGAYGGTLRYYFDDPIHLLPDVDGIRVLRGQKLEYIRRVPDSLVEIFKIGSTSPPAILLDAQQQFEGKSPKINYNIQLIRPQLAEAVDTCVKAAGHTFDSHWQKRLLKAASLGKSALDLYNSDVFVEMCETLRVLNSCRNYKVGISLTYEQFSKLSAERLIQRLLSRRQYTLALRLADYLHLPTEGIYIDWASVMVRTSSQQEDVICQTIVSRLSKKTGVSYEGIARAAYEEGRVKLATQLLDYEPRAGRQVPLLMTMEEDGSALVKAIASGDMDLVFYVLWYLKKKLPLAQFFRMINNKPTAASLIERYSRQQDLPLLKDYYYQADRRADGANVFFQESFDADELQTRLDKVRAGLKLLADSRENAFQSKILEEHATLLKSQHAMAADLGESFDGLSVTETIAKLVKTGQSSCAAKIKGEHKISDRRFWWIKLRALAERRDWDEIDQFSKSKKSPIGYEPFFQECLDAGNNRQAAKYIPRCTNVSAVTRVEMWVKAGDLKNGGQEAFRAKDRVALQQIRGRAPEGLIARELDSLLDQLPPR